MAVNGLFEDKAVEAITAERFYRNGRHAADAGSLKPALALHQELFQRVNNLQALTLRYI
jgi:hypothetical protein